MSPDSKVIPRPLCTAALASIAGLLSTPRIDAIPSCSAASAVSSPLPHPRSTASVTPAGSTSASRSWNGLDRSSANLWYCAGFQSAEVVVTTCIVLVYFAAVNRSLGAERLGGLHPRRRAGG